ncbi:MAG: glycosyltransferase [Bacteroidota bacterium]
MRIALFSALYPYRGGIAQFSGALFNALAEKHDVEPFTFSRQYPDFLFPGKSQLVTPDDPIAGFESQRVLDSINPFTWLSAASAIRKTESELLITNYWIPLLAPAVGTMAGRLKKDCKRISILHNVVPHEKRPLDKELSTYFVNRHDGFVTLSESVKDDLLKLRPDANCIVLPHPLYDHFGAKTDKAAAIKALGLPEDKKLLLYFGYIRDYKGLDLLIEAMSKLDDSYHLVLAGESYGDFTKYSDQITQLGVDHRITRLTRYIPDQEVALLFSAADACILPYKSATQSGVTAIALHFEIPLIVTNVGGLKELVFHEKTGLLVEQPTAEHIVKQIHNFYDNHQHTDFASNIRELKEALSWGTFADKLVEFAAGM